MTNTNILYCVLHTHRYISRYKSIMDTWGKNQNIIFYADYEDKGIDNLIKVTDNDHYNSNEEKNINVFKVINGHQIYNNYDWYFFCDDDTFVNTSQLHKLINTNISIESVYGLLANSWPPDKTLWYCGGGAGYLLSNYILTHFLCNAVNYHTGFSDVSVGINCKKFGITMKHIDGFNSFPPYDHRNLSTIQDPGDAITFHYIKTTQEMSELHARSIARL